MLYLCKHKTETDFKGKETLKQLATLPLKRRLLGFTVDDASVDLNGNEVIYRDGNNIVGYIKRAGYGYTIGKHIGFGYVELTEKERTNSRKETLHKLLQSTYELEVMGKRVKAKPFVTAPYDPERAKLEL